MDMREEEPSGALYRLDADLSLHVLKKDIIVSNAPAGAPPARRSILPIPGRAKSAPGTTTPRPAIFPANGSFAMSIAAKAARRDGATVDSEGYLWNALVYAGKLVRYTPEGKVDRIIEMPVKKVTSVMFGGENLDVLYVTSMAQPPLPRFPEDNQLRGSLFAIYDLGVTGVAERRFAG